MLHVAFVTPEVKAQVLSGEKTIESRLSLRRHPASDVKVGDTLIFKCRDAFGKARANLVEVYRDVTPDMLANELFPRYTLGVDGPVPDGPYWNGKLHCQHAVFIAFGPVTPITIAQRYFKPNGTGWIRWWEKTPEYRSFLLSGNLKSSGLVP